MTLSEAQEYIKDDVEKNGEYGYHEFEGSVGTLNVAEAIATILNAVVKGELK